MMRNRGRQTATSLTAPRAIDKAPRLTPPACLTSTERAIFAELIESTDERHFARSDLPMIISYVQAVALARATAHKPKARAEWREAVKLQMALARSLRLTVQSRTDPKTVGRRTPDLITERPWLNDEEED